MKNNVRTIFGILPLLLLSSCTSKNELFSSFFKDYTWTKWVSEDEQTQIFVEGTNQYLCGMGQINQLGIKDAYINMCHRPVTKSFLEYRTDDGGRGILNIVKSNKKDFPLRVFDDNPEIEFYLKPVKIQESEIDIRYFQGTVIYNKENNLSFPLHGTIRTFEEKLSVISSFNDVETTLSILGENKFIFERNGLISNGVYTTTYEGATFTFEENQIFEGENSIVLSFRAWTTKIE